MMMKHSAWALALGLGLVVSGASAQQVWKCEVGGLVRYSDRPCDSPGQTLPTRQLQPNVADSLKPDVLRAALAPASAPVVAAVGNACPGDAEIRDMQTRGNSTSLGDAERQFMQDEVRRAWQCRKGQGRYSDADWAISRSAQAAQSQLSDRARQDARQRAEDMHSAADPDEGDRIARLRLAQVQARLRAEQQAARRSQNPASEPTH